MLITFKTASFTFFACLFSLIQQCPLYTWETYRQISLETSLASPLAWWACAIDRSKTKFAPDTRIYSSRQTFNTFIWTSAAVSFFQDKTLHTSITNRWIRERTVYAAVLSTPEALTWFRSHRIWLFTCHTLGNIAWITCKALWATVYAGIADQDGWSLARHTTILIPSITRFAWRITSCTIWAIKVESVNTFQATIFITLLTPSEAFFAFLCGLVEIECICALEGTRQFANLEPEVLHQFSFFEISTRYLFHQSWKQFFSLSWVGILHLFKS